MSELGRTLRQAREAAGLSLAGMARRTGYSRSYLGNVECGVRQVTPALIRAYERALGDDVDRRMLLIGLATTAVAGATPDVAGDVFRDISAERTGLLSAVQTTHATDRLIASLVARERSSLASLAKWMRKGPPVLRVNSAGILSKVGLPVLDNEVVDALKADSEARTLYLTACAGRVLGLPWAEAGQIVAGNRPLRDSGQLTAFAAEARNRYDAGARFCAVLMLARTRGEAPKLVDDALGLALKQETSREVLRSIAGSLAGIDPLTV
jgi:transcriptional regulator with XRE-family HTH domain